MLAPLLEVAARLEVLLDARLHVAWLQHERRAGDLLVGPEVRLRGRHAHVLGNLGQGAVTLEAPLADEPLAQVLLVEHALILAPGEARLVLVRHPVAAGGSWLGFFPGPCG